MRVIPEGGETNEVSPMIALDYCLRIVSRQWYSGTGRGNPSRVDSLN